MKETQRMVDEQLSTNFKFKEAICADKIEK